METEFIAIHHQQTLDHIDLHKSKTITDCLWIFKIKCNSDGSMSKYKVIIKSYKQKHGFDYDKIFNLIIKIIIIHIFGALVISLLLMMY